MTGDDRTPEPASGDEPQLPPEIEQVLRELTGGAPLPPQLREFLAGAGLDQIDPTMLGAMAGQLQALFAGGNDAGGLDLGQTRAAATQAIAASTDPAVSARGTQEVTDAVRVADLWLDPVTEFGCPTLTAAAWTRAQWVEETMPQWAQAVEPIADGVSGAVQAALGKQLRALGEGGLPPGLVPEGVNPAAMIGQVEAVMRRLHGSLFSLQLGQGLGGLSGEVLSGCEPMLPLVAGDVAALLPRNVADFAEGLSLPASEVLMYAAVREVARVRLFHAVPWLGPQMLAAVRDYAAGIVIDTDAIESSIARIDPSDPDAVRQALEGRLFAAPTHTPAQQHALARLEASLALVEGWVDVVTSQAVSATLPHGEALGEAIRRRRATGGPAETTFAALVGLELRPRRLRDAANLFQALQAAGGSALRDRAWEHPDLAPTVTDLDDVLGYVDRLVSPDQDAMDQALADLLGESGGSGSGADDPDPQR